MYSQIDSNLVDSVTAAEAERIIRSCVHCGFCLPACPTYAATGNELDSPRGRIYLMKDMLEGGAVEARVTAHLDRCLTCRACEPACPSDVEYGRLLDIGRGVAVEAGPGKWRHRALTWLLRQIVPSPRLLAVVVGVGGWFRPLLPARLQRYLPPTDNRALAPASGEREVVVLQGCVQRTVTPGVNRALSSLLAARGIRVRMVAEEGCCGALDYHLGAHQSGLARARKLIDALLPHLDSAEAILSTASGCGVTIKDYPYMFRRDGEYRDKAEQVAAACVDASEFLAQLDFRAAPVRVACHTPCTFQHGQKLAGFEAILRRAGLEIVPSPESGMCCGSAGVYSMLEPDMAETLRSRKLAALGSGEPQVIATANVGCQLHLSGADVPVKHWLELLADQVRLFEQPPE